MRLAGKSDPYCKLRVGRKKKLSKVKSKTLNPRWNETFSFSQVNLKYYCGLPLRVTMSWITSSGMQTLNRVKQHNIDRLFSTGRPFAGRPSERSAGTDRRPALGRRTDPNRSLRSAWEMRYNILAINSSYGAVQIEIILARTNEQQTPLSKVLTSVISRFS
jgi:hypothetical protein